MRIQALTKLASALAAAAIFAVMMPFASAQEVETWGTAGPWDILIDHSVGSGCFIQAEFDNGSLVRIGLDREKGEAYMTAFHDDWQGIEEGTTYGIAFDIDGASYDGEAVGIYLNGVPGADIYFDNEEFFLDIMAGNVMTLYNENGEVMAISLAGTMAGLDGVLECQDEIDG